MPSNSNNNNFHPTSSSLKQQQQEISSDIPFSLWHTFKFHIPRFLLTILIDIILPLILFLLLQKRIKSIYALLIAGIPPLIMILFKAILLRTFDALGFLILISFIISAIITAITRNSIILLIEKSIVTGMISFIAGITLIPFQCCQHRCHWRPIAYYFYQDLIPIKRAQIGLSDNIFVDKQDTINKQNENEISIQKLSSKEEVAQVYKWIYEHCQSFRRFCYLITSIWSIGYLLEFLTRIILILVHLSINKIVIYGYIILSSITVVCILLTIICVINERKQTLASIKQMKEKHLPIWTVTDNFNANNTVVEINYF